MYHSINFIDIFNPEDRKNTWDDWHLIPSSRPHVSPPTHNSKSLEIPGLNGVIDISDLLTGYPTYGQRTGRWKFYVENDYWDWAVAYTTIMGYLHGKRLHCILEDDPGYYYEGRFKVEDWDSGKTHSAISITYDLYPYKKRVVSSSEDWLWDPFNFELDTIQEKSSMISITQDSPLEFTIYGDDEPICPSITISDLASPITIRSRWYDSPSGQEYSPTHTINQNGTYRLSGLLIRKGRNGVMLTGEGLVTIDYRGGLF